MNEDKCYFHPECTEPPTCSVRWSGTRHYNFLCAQHLTEHQAAGHIATVYSIDHLLKRQQAIIAKYANHPDAIIRDPGNGDNIQLTTDGLVEVINRPTLDPAPLVFTDY